MIALAFAATAALGAYLVYTSIVFRWRGLRFGPGVTSRARRRRSITTWLTEAGLGDLRLRDLLTASLALFAAATAAVFVIFGALAPSIAVGAFAAAAPATSARVQRQTRRARAQDAWPRMLEELRIHTGNLGRSIPQALFEVGRRAPAELVPAFEAAQREWLMSTDFARTISVLKSGLADPTADAACETLLVAHEVGGNDLDGRLAALIEDRLQDVNGRKDARARQAGARFARRFVLIVPFGMALAGMSVGDGREAFREPTGQVLTCVAVGLVVGCWVWAGHVMRLPEEERVFAA